MEKQQQSLLQLTQEIRQLREEMKHVPKSKK